VRGIRDVARRSPVPPATCTRVGNPKITLTVTATLDPDMPGYVPPRDHLDERTSPCGLIHSFP
jgi:hypothetical protein